mgnify:CR=1 FL=1
MILTVSYPYFDPLGKIRVVKIVCYILPCLKGDIVDERTCTCWIIFSICHFADFPLSYAYKNWWRVSWDLQLMALYRLLQNADVMAGGRFGESDEMKVYMSKYLAAHRNN